MQTIGSNSCNLIGYRLKSGAKQSMLIRELQLYKARFGTKNAILILVLERPTQLAPSSGWNLHIVMATSKQPLSDMEIIKGEEEAEIAEGLQRVINPQEASRHVQMLDETLNNMDTRIKNGKVKDIMNDAITQFKDIIF